MGSGTQPPPPLLRPHLCSVAVVTSRWCLTATTATSLKLGSRRQRRRGGLPSSSWDCDPSRFPLLVVPNGWDATWLQGKLGNVVFVLWPPIFQNGSRLAEWMFGEDRQRLPQSSKSFAWQKRRELALLLSSAEGPFLPAAQSSKKGGKWQEWQEAGWGLQSRRCEK